FQAEDGIRDYKVTGVQTCALPISARLPSSRAGNLLLGVRGMMEAALCICRLSSIYETEPISEVEQPPFLNMIAEIGNPLPTPERSEERRVGKECRSRWELDKYNKT